MVDIKIFNVGQGDCFLINDARSTPILIDVGPSKRNNHPAENDLINKEVNLILTHAHSDHIGGLKNLPNLKINKLFVPNHIEEINKIGKFLRMLDKKINPKQMSLRYGGLDYFYSSQFEGKIVHLYDECDEASLLNLKNARIEVLNPTKEKESLLAGAQQYFDEFKKRFPQKNFTDFEDVFKNDENTTYLKNFIYMYRSVIDALIREIQNNSVDDTGKELIKYLFYEYKFKSNNLSIVFKLKTKQSSALFTGDLEKEGWSRILNVHGDTILSDIDVIKMPHHGSKTGMTQEVIDLLLRGRLKQAIFSFGKNNWYRHPYNIWIYLFSKNKKSIHLTNEINVNTPAKIYPIRNGFEIKI